MSQIPKAWLLTAKDWFDFINKHKGQPVNLYTYRAACYSNIEQLRGRPLLVYASYFPNKSDRILGSHISLDISDVDGFADLVRHVPQDQTSVDVLIQTPGGSAEAAERIVHILRQRFTEVHFLVAHSAYSAGTMLALSGDSITLHPIATLGPIDPQINGVPARSIERGFEQIREKLKTGGPDELIAYVPMLEKYSLHLLELCKDSQLLAKSLVTKWLTEYMFKHRKRNRKKVVQKAVDFFANYDEHLTHSKSLVYSEVNHLKLEIYEANQPLADLLREAWLLLRFSFENPTTNLSKVYENSHGLAWGPTIQ